jgi:hypothetical protein
VPGVVAAGRRVTERPGDAEFRAARGGARYACSPPLTAASSCIHPKSLHTFRSSTHPGRVRPASITATPHLMVIPQKKTEKMPLRCSSSPIRYAKKPSSATRDTSLQGSAGSRGRSGAGRGGSQDEIV